MTRGNPSTPTNAPQDDNRTADWPTDWGAAQGAADRSPDRHHLTTDEVDR